MSATDVEDTLNLALEAPGLEQAKVQNRPRLLSDNGPCYTSGQLADWLEDKGMSHTRGAPYHPQTQGKIERWHQTLKNHILLENYFLPEYLKNQIAAFVGYYNHQRYHESLKNLAPADVYTGARTNHFTSARENKKENNESKALAARQKRYLNYNQRTKPKEIIAKLSDAQILIENRRQFYRITRPP